MILVVAGVTAFYVLSEFSVPEINFVRDTPTKNPTGNEMVIHRLYAAGVDTDAFAEKVEGSLVAVEFSEDEIYAAALASGTPEFYPAFYFTTVVADPINNVFVFGAGFNQEYYKGQENSRFDMTNVHIEIESAGFALSNFEADTVSDGDKKAEPEVLSEDFTTLADNLNDSRSYHLRLKGNNGRLTIRYTYDIKTTGIFPSTAVTGQYLEVYADVSYTTDKGLVVLYTNEPYSNLEDLED
jgi:hypothetical protein